MRWILPLALSLLAGCGPRITSHMDDLRGGWLAAWMPQRGSLTCSWDSEIIVYLGPGETCGPASVPTLAIHGGCQSWRLLEEHTIILLIDGQRTMLESEHSGDAYSGGVIEHVSAPITWDLVRSIARAQSVRGAIGTVDITISASDRAVIADLLRRCGR